MHTWRYCNQKYFQLPLLQCLPIEHLYVPFYDNGLERYSSRSTPKSVQIVKQPPSPLSQRWCSMCVRLECFDKFHCFLRLLYYKHTHHVEWHVLSTGSKGTSSATANAKCAFSVGVCVLCRIRLIISYGAFSALGLSARLSLLLIEHRGVLPPLCAHKMINQASISHFLCPLYESCSDWSNLEFIMHH